MDEKAVGLQGAGLPRVYTVAQIAVLFGRGRAYVYKLIRKGLVRAHRLNGSVVILEPDAIEFLNANLKPYAPERSWHPSARKRGRRA